MPVAERRHRRPFATRRRSAGTAYPSDAAMAETDAQLLVRRESWSSWIAYWFLVPWTWLKLTIHNSHGILRVWDIIHFRPMPPGLIGPTHPWVTGEIPSTGEPIWPRNIVYRSPSRLPRDSGEDDEAIVSKIGGFLAAMVARSAVVPEIPWGRARRMPHGINYIHGAIHYNAGFILLDDFRDGFRHFSDPAFVGEARRFARETRRELVVIFRRRDYDLVAYAEFIAFVRTMLPWFCNSNGPKKRVLWGNPAPYPVVNIITGNWIRDTYRLKSAQGPAAVVRPPLDGSGYFCGGPYRGVRESVRWPERMLAVLTYFRIRLRGVRGGLFFVNRKKLIPATLRRQKELGIADEPIARLEFFRRSPPRRRRIP